MYFSNDVEDWETFRSWTSHIFFCLSVQYQPLSAWFRQFNWQSKTRNNKGTPLTRICRWYMTTSSINLPQKIFGYFIRTKQNSWRDFNFPIVNFSFICSNIPAAPADWIFLSVDTIFQIERVGPSFFDKGLLLTMKLLNQVLQILVVKLNLLLRKFEDCHYDLLAATEYLWYRWPRIRCVCRNHNTSFIFCDVLVDF